MGFLPDDPPSGLVRESYPRLKRLVVPRPNVPYCPQPDVRFAQSTTPDSRCGAVRYDGSMFALYVALEAQCSGTWAPCHIHPPERRVGKAGQRPIDNFWSRFGTHRRVSGTKETAGSKAQSSR